MHTPEHEAPDSYMEELLRRREVPPEGLPPVPQELPMPYMPESGALIFGTSAAQLGGPVIPLRGALAGIGGGLGYAGGRASQRLAMLPQTPSFDDLAKDFMDATKMGLIQGAGEMAFPAIGAALGPAAAIGRRMAGTQLGRFGQLISPPKGITPEAQKAEGMLKSVGAPGLTMGQLGPLGTGAEVRFVNVMENVANASLVSRGFGRTREKIREGLQSYADNAADALSREDPSTIGEALRQVVEKREGTLYTAPADALFTEIRAAVPDLNVNIQPVMDVLTRERRAPLFSAVVGNLLKIREKNPAAIDQLVAMLESPTPLTGRMGPSPTHLVSLDQAQYFKTAIGRVLDKRFSDAAGQQMADNAGRLAQTMKGIIHSSLAEVDPNLAAKYMDATDMVRQGFEEFHTRLITGLMTKLEEQPGKLLQVLWQKDNQDLLRAVREAAGPFYEQRIQPRIISELVMNARDPLTGRIGGSALATQLTQYGPEMVEAGLGPKAFNEWMDIARAIKIGEDPARGLGTMFIQMRQATMIGGAGLAGYNIITGNEDAALGYTGGALTAFLSPWAFYKMTADPRLVKAFKIGILDAKVTPRGQIPSKMATFIRQLGFVSVGAATIERPKMMSPMPQLPSASSMEMLLQEPAAGSIRQAP